MARKTSKSKIPYGLKLGALVLIFIFYSFALYFSGFGLIGRKLKEFSLGVFGFSGYFLPFVIFFIVLFKMNKNFKKRRFFLITSVIMLFFTIILLIGVINSTAILLKFDSIIKQLKHFYDTGVILKSSGVIGSYISLAFIKTIGKIGSIIVSIFLIISAGFLLTGVTIRQIRKDFSSFLKRKQEILDKRKIELEKEEDKKRIEKIADDVVKDKTIKTNHIFVTDKAKPETEKISKPTTEEKIEVNNEISKNVSKPANTSKYIKPDISLLDDYDNSTKTIKKDDIKDMTFNLEKILNNFNVVAKVVGVSSGPIVNRFEIELEPGTKLAKVNSLQDDIALNLAVEHVRIAAVPGKAAVGIEVPNKNKSIVSLKDVFKSNVFKNNKSDLKLGLGKSISGKVSVVNLESMPHLLIAGATGSGKSVCINTIIASILFNCSADEVKLLMIDPKLVELNVYNGIPHLILPVVTDAKKAAIALDWAVNEMVDRYNKFAESKSKDIKSYNEKNKDNKLSKIVIIIDELSDLMMVASNQVEDSIARLTQMARAAGIHLIVATQRPSVDVITGLIKANIPTRIAFSVSSYVDSKTILDKAGAEKLLGKGDMLYKAPSNDNPIRIQGAFVSEKEIERIVSFIKNQSIETEYKEEILIKKEVETLEVDDELYEEAIRLVIENESASASLLQRRLRIGYNRAGRLIDAMHENGIVGPPQGSKPREILNPDYLNEVDEN